MNALLRELEEALLEQQIKIESMLRVVRKLEADSGRCQEATRYEPTTTWRSKPERGRRQARLEPRSGVWQRAIIKYFDGRRTEPSYLTHLSPMAKLAEACGCYMGDWWPLVTPYLGNDAVITIPSEIRKKPNALRPGEPVEVELTEWEGPI